MPPPGERRCGPTGDLRCRSIGRNMERCLPPSRCTMFGFTTSVFAHVLVSLVGIVTGFVVIGGLLRSQRLPAVTIVFLATTTLTSAGGFLLPSSGLTPARVL